MVASTDDGRTWGPPRNLTSEVKDPAWSYLLQGPGRGITMGDGTLVFPAQYQASPDESRTPHSTVLVSRDHGETWRVGSAAKPNTTEAAVVELADGVLMLNMRDNRGGARAVHTSDDLGASWTAHATTRKALVEPVCMASLIHVGRELDGEADGRLVFSNPNVSAAPRRRMTLQASNDSGRTWLPAKVLLDEGQLAGYSCLTMIDAETVGILYEGSRAHMTFQRIPLIDLFPE
jgi:sialidase-1